MVDGPGRCYSSRRMSDLAVVKVLATTQNADYDLPWNARAPRASTGSGVVVSANHILTGAHVVANATFIQVQKISDPEKHIVQVKSISHDCDLALLEVEDGFLEEIEAPELGELPTLRDRVSVVGYPIGGEEVSVTEGVVSRIEVQRYAHSQRHFLAVTVDAAINPGNSGGPVFKDGKIVGIAFQALDEGEAIGEMVPVPIIRHFLQLAQNQPRVLLPSLGVVTQTLENPELRKHLGMSKEQSGLLISDLEFGSSVSGKLEIGDVILQIAGNKIANNGTIQYRGKHRMRFDVLLGESAVGETLTLHALRDGKEFEVDIELKAWTALVPRSQYEQEPVFFVLAGFIFQRLSRDYLAIWDDWWDAAPKEFLHDYFSGMRREDRREVIILSQVLADEINQGYEERYRESIIAVGDTKPRDMKHFVELVENAKDTLVMRTSQGGLIVLDAKEAQASQSRILKRYHIPRDRNLS